MTMENPPPEFWQDVYTYDPVTETKVSNQDIELLCDLIHKVCTDEFTQDYNPAVSENPTAVLAMVCDWLELYTRGYDRYVRKVEWIS